LLIYVRYLVMPHGKMAACMPCFPPLRLPELAHLRCTVSLLHSFELASRWDAWEVGTHGLLIEFADPATGARRTSTFLPEVAASEAWDRAQTIDRLVRKAGCAAPGAELRARVRVTRYQSTTCALSYEEYVKLRKGVGWGRASAAAEGEASKVSVPVQA
jgi:AMMECR1 domain-containing protein